MLKINLIGDLSLLELVSQSLFERRIIRLARQSELRLKMGSSYQDNDIVFATNLETPIHRRFLIRYHFKPTLRRAGLDEAIRLYDLRHSYVSLSFLSGVPVKVVSEQAGHARVAFTLDTYAHVLPEEREGASDKLERLLISGAP